jgi:hypothetical protein
MNTRDEFIAPHGNRNHIADEIAAPKSKCILLLKPPAALAISVS